MVKTKTQKDIFLEFLAKRGFTVHSSVYSLLSLVPRFRVSARGRHNLITGIAVSIFEGVNTAEGDLGCVTFGYEARIREKRCKNIYQGSMFKKSFCPKTAAEAKREFIDWEKTTREKIDKMKVLF